VPQAKDVVVEQHMSAGRRWRDPHGVGPQRRAIVHCAKLGLVTTDDHGRPRVEVARPVAQKTGQSPVEQPQEVGHAYRFDTVRRASDVEGGRPGVAAIVAEQRTGLATVVIVGATEPARVSQQPSTIGKHH